ncbi:hypothetical protein TKK_0018816 [Trichogramma kaykai]|uniref:Uncharacterized protein n=1 Tax=Trichogramma kaykai TaxID=54128 RepID=A0ABD2VVN1_9HYME
MSYWYSGSESEDEQLNFNLFARKNFGFVGLPEEQEVKFRNLVMQLGAVCSKGPKYVFTSKDYYEDVRDDPQQITGTLYDMAYIRDCVDANRCLSIDQYRLHPKPVEKKDYRDFDPCCNAMFHSDKDNCDICYANLIENPPPQPITKPLLPPPPKPSLVPISAPRNNVYLSNNAPQVWEHWEKKLLLDYIIQHEAYFQAKSPSLFKRIFAEGYLSHRSPESMRVYFRKRILRNIESFDLPKPIVKIFKQVRDAGCVARFSTNKLK